MGSFTLDQARIPRAERADVLKREIAVHLYAREILPKAAARRLSGMDRVAFDALLGERGIASRLTPDDLDHDLADLIVTAVPEEHAAVIATGGGPAASGVAYRDFDVAGGTLRIAITHTPSD